MVKYISRRLFQSFFTLIGITIIAFLIMVSAPGNPASQLTLNPDLNQQQRKAIADSMGVNDPIHIQYIRWMFGDAPYTIGDYTLWEGRHLPVFDRRGMRAKDENGEEKYIIGDNKGIIRGDLGRSLVHRKRVIELVKVRLPATLELGLLSLTIGLVVGIPTGVLAAINQGGIFDQITRIMSVIVSAIPVFWLGLVLIIVFGAWLELLPMGNRFPISISGEYTLEDRLRHLILPTITLSSFTIATFSRFMRASVLDVLNQDYIRTAKAKGLVNTDVWFVHAMRNALIPIATLLGPAFTGVISGAVLTETVYSWPGMGRLILEAIGSQDYPVIMSVVLMFSFATIVGYLISDILYAVFDPRVRLS